MSKLGKPHLIARGRDAPIVSDWPSVAGESIQVDGLTCLSPNYAEEIAVRMAILDTYPIACQETIELNRTTCDTNAGTGPGGTPGILLAMALGVGFVLGLLRSLLKAKR